MTKAPGNTVHVERVATMEEPSISMVEKAAPVDLKNADLALQILHDIDVSPEEVAAVDEKSFLRKVDLHMLPIVSPLRSIWKESQLTRFYRCLLPYCFFPLTRQPLATRLSWESAKTPISHPENMHGSAASSVSAISSPTCLAPS